MREKIEHYVWEGLEKKNPKALRFVFWLLDFLSVGLGFIYSQVYKFYFMPYLIVALSVAATIYGFIITKRSDPKSIIKAIAFTVLSVIIICQLSAIMIYIKIKGFNWLVVLMLILPILSSVLVLVLNISRLKKKNKDKTKKSSDIGKIGIGGGAIALTINRITEDIGLSEEVGLLIGLTILAFFTTFFSGSFLKLYYIKKYNLSK